MVGEEVGGTLHCNRSDRLSVSPTLNTRWSILAVSTRDVLMVPYKLTGQSPLSPRPRDGKGAGHNDQSWEEKFARDPVEFKRCCGVLCVHDILCE